MMPSEDRGVYANVSNGTVSITKRLVLPEFETYDAERSNFGSYALRVTAKDISFQRDGALRSKPHRPAPLQSFE